ncbi:phenylacetaldehyde reductase-like isoform X2 [Salvia miltiorrhiza]|uniref:phenylacetaldehyde reductase-like isoform X2 n=1 Tax=Salvia miltiorrhiza TaxID=226208 RepID=UPI0025ACD688|nr:phenylacetaldehyde reductase-like isoform X2 [Salvia miltiorrhiza]
MGDKVVCVTGASGYVASWLVKLLLRRGYTVKATVRNLSDPSKVGHLRALEGAEERLHLFEANLVKEGSFDGVIDGCDGVFHTASPVILEHVNDPQVELIQPAVKGTLNVLSSCAKAQSVKRVVFTSSIATIAYKKHTQTTDVLVDETSFSDPIFAEEMKQWYVVSKTLAEEAAFKFAQENGIDLVIINPGLVIGPLLQPTLNETSQCFLSLISEGKYTNATPGGMFIYVDVRDVGNAHILAFEDSSANGRYCLVANVMPCAQVLDILRQLYPTVKFPMCQDEENPSALPLLQVCNEKAKSLGINFTSVEQSVKDVTESLIEKKFFKISEFNI